MKIHPEAAGSRGQNPYSLIASSLAILSSIGGCVLNNFIIAPPLKGLTISICAVLELHESG